MVLAREDSPVYLMGGFDLMAAMLDNQPKVQAAFKSGGGVADLGCGHGWSTVPMAKGARTPSLSVAIFHARSIAEARALARAQGVSANARFGKGLCRQGVRSRHVLRRLA